MADKKSQKQLKTDYANLVKDGIKTEEQAEKLVKAFYSNIKTDVLYVTEDANVFKVKGPAINHAKLITGANKKGNVYIVPIK